MAGRPNRSASIQGTSIQGAALQTGAPDPAADSLDKVKAILAPLDRAQKSKLFELVQAGHLEDDQMTIEVGRLIVAMLNGPRSEHARRIWTGWFDPVMLRTDALMLAEARPPGCMHVVDAGAWWFALLPHLRELAGRVQADIAARASEHPLDAVLASPAAADWAEELRAGSLAVLRRRGAAGPLLATANAERATLLRKRGLGNGRMGGVAPLSMGDLAMLDAMLEHAALWRGTVRPRDTIGILHSVSGMIGSGGEADGAQLYALSLVNASRDPDQALALYGLFPNSSLVEAAVGHAQFAWQGLRQKLEDLHLGRPAPPQLTAGETAERLAERAFRWYDALQGFGIERGGRNWAAVSTAVGRTTGLVEGEVVPVLSHRLLTLNATASAQPLIEPVRFINSFNHRLRRRGIAASSNPWLPAIGEHLAALFRQIGVYGRDDALPAMARLCELAEETGYPIEVTAIDKTLLAIVESALRDGRELTGGENRLIERVVTVATEERRKCRWWVSGELVSLLDAAQQRGIGPTPA
ncbi:hypothetical protein VY88_16910 [Azospirillum thiophilum]|uniref:Uncharacterized protein n=1 Tax=Azospirillum thiophilum TaxID=528244 RepID=A0AAC8ZUX3_9PROT|nr:hypothetical protein [Azospirillum thiophilum]ALG72652.1 hypothetical protein AL072_16605 [Azospirillum thiophilum]KJR64431.1 hypothetical protein VY88_16910 [Azospirillum thiophilum]